MEMSQADYARHRGVSRAAVSQWLKARRIRLLPNGKISVADADFALGATQERAVAREPEPAASPQRGPAGNSSLTAAKTAEAIYDTRIKQLKFEQMRGNLVPTAEVVEATINCSETMLRAFDRITSHAEEFVGKDLHGARGVLKSIERELREAASRAFTELAANAKRAAMAHADDEGEV